MLHRLYVSAWLFAGLAASLLAQAQPPAGSPAQPQHRSISAADYPSIQAAIDANPGRSIYVPAGDYTIDKTLLINKDHTALQGPGRIIQTSPNDSIVRIDSAAFTRVTGLTLTRPDGKPETTQEGLTVRSSRFTEISGVRVLDNHGPAGSIRVMDSTDTTVRECLVYNYMLVTIEDRTGSSLYGFGFKAIDGTGIVITGSPGLLLTNNRVIEENLLATPEIQKRYDLGHIIKRNAQRGTAMSEEQWKQEYVQSNWHQGSGIYVGTSSGRVIGNQVRNAAQGMDIHSDNVIVSNNIIENSHMGMKAMHGARNVAIIGNQFIKPSLWGIALSSGTNSHLARTASGSEPAQEANLDGGSIIANNVISDFGYGRAGWNWATHGNRAPIFLAGSDETPLKDVVVQGNVVFDPGRDSLLVDGQPQVVPPKYLYAVMVQGKVTGLHFSGNMLHPGSQGVSNIEMTP